MIEIESISTTADLRSISFADLFYAIYEKECTDKDVFDLAKRLKPDLETQIDTAVSIIRDKSINRYSRQRAYVFNRIGNHRLLVPLILLADTTDDHKLIIYPRVANRADK